MLKYTLSLLAVTILLLGSAPALAASPDEVEIEGPVTAFDPNAGTLVVGGYTFIINTETQILTGRGRGTPATTAEISVGVWADVSGEMHNGVLIARRIRIKPWENESPPGGPPISPPAGPPDDRPGGPPIVPPGQANRPQAPAGQHPVIARIAAQYGLDYDSVAAMHASGIGLGLIMKSYALAETNPDLNMNGEDWLALHQSGEGWGKIMQNLGLHPSKSSGRKTP